MKLLILFVLGVCSLARKPEVHMLIARALTKAHRSRQVHLTMAVSRLVDAWARANQIVLLVRELILLLVVHDR